MTAIDKPLMQSYPERPAVHTGSSDIGKVKVGSTKNAPAACIPLSVTRQEQDEIVKFGIKGRDFTVDTSALENQQVVVSHFRKAQQPMSKATLRLTGTAAAKLNQMVPTIHRYDSFLNSLEKQIKYLISSENPGADLPEVAIKKYNALIAEYQHIHTEMTDEVRAGRRPQEDLTSLTRHQGSYIDSLKFLTSQYKSGVDEPIWQPPVLPYTVWNPDVPNSVDSSAIQTNQKITTLHKDTSQLIQKLNKAALSGSSDSIRELDGDIRQQVETYESLLDTLTKEASKGLRPQEDVENLMRYQQPFMNKFSHMINEQAAKGLTTWQAPLVTIRPQHIRNAKSENQGLDSRIDRTKINKATIISGQAEVTGEVIKAYADLQHAEFELNGCRCRYWPDNPQVAAAMRGRLEIETDGLNLESTDKLFETLRDIGVDSHRSTINEQVESYLDRHAHLHHLSEEMAIQTPASDDESLRIQSKKSFLEKKLNHSFHNLQSEAQGQRIDGRTIHLRADLSSSDDFKSFASGHRLVHEIATARNNPKVLIQITREIIRSGGRISSSVERMMNGSSRKGLSVSKDMETGGASYAFTRIQPIQANGSKNIAAYDRPGFVWKADLLSRLDAVTFDADLYGDVSEENLRSNRKLSVDDFQQTAHSRANETLFKDNLSLLEGLDCIVVKNEEIRSDMIKMLKEEGMDPWPGGQTAEELIKIAAVK